MNTIPKYHVNPTDEINIMGGFNGEIPYEGFHAIATGMNRWNETEGFYEVTFKAGHPIFPVGEVYWNEEYQMWKIL